MSIATATFSNVVVAGIGTYIPSYLKADGKVVSQQLKFNAFINDFKRPDRTGNVVSLTAWGALADLLAVTMTPGQTMSFSCTIEPYEGKARNEDMSLRLDAAGQPFKTAKIGFTIEKFEYGKESTKMIQQQIERGERPVNWNVMIGPNQPHADRAAWIEELNKRRNLVWNMNSTGFGYTKVLVPQNVTINAAAYQPKQPQAQVKAQGQAVSGFNYGQQAQPQVQPQAQFHQVGGTIPTPPQAHGFSY